MCDTYQKFVSNQIILQAGNNLLKYLYQEVWGVILNYNMMGQDPLIVNGKPYTAHNTGNFRLGNNWFCIIGNMDPVKLRLTHNDG